MYMVENYYIELFHHNNAIIQEQSHIGNNRLFQLIHDAQSRDTYTRLLSELYLPAVPVST